MAGMFAGQAAIVTGGASNIGRAIAVALAAEGADVTILDIDPDGASRTVATIAAAGGRAQATTVDLTRRADTIAALRHYLDERGPPHLVVHSANASVVKAGRFFSVGADDWDRTIAVALDAGFSIGRVLGAAMVRANVAGRFVFVTSLHAEVPLDAPHYSAAKAGLTMMMKEMARTLGPRGIRVNAIAPGYVPLAETGIVADRRIPMQRVGRPEEIAAMTLVLLSDRFSSYVTGTTVAVDGGLGLMSWTALRT